MNSPVYRDLADPEIDQEVAREIYARVSNWLMFHEWHPAIYGFE